VFPCSQRPAWLNARLADNLETASVLEHGENGNRSPHVRFPGPVQWPGQRVRLLGSHDGNVIREGLGPRKILLVKGNLVETPGTVEIKLDLLIRIVVVGRRAYNPRDFRGTLFGRGLADESWALTLFARGCAT